MKPAERVTVLCPCGNEFTAAIWRVRAGRGKFCSKACKYRYQTRPSGLKYKIVKENPTSFKPGHVPWVAGTKGAITAWNKGMKGLHLSPATEFRPGDNAGPANPRWAGENVGYDGMHRRLYRERGPAANYPCAQADETCKGPMHWANLSGQYRDTSDFVPMCQSHHFRHDGVRPKR
jgi:hypothetical protein